MRALQKYSNQTWRRMVAAGSAAFAVAVTLAACESPQATDAQAAQTQAAAPVTSATPTQETSGMISLQRALKKDMAYADVRKLALDYGWTPISDPQCRIQVAGYDEKTCSANPELALCKACTQLPELSAYSGDGYATMRFASAGQQLKVISQGMIEDWNAPGADSRLRVEEWEFSETP